MAIDLMNKNLIPLKILIIENERNYKDKKVTIFYTKTKIKV